ncbi:Pyridinium-3,5-bisthiocarboxylic acid mononucleotide nickel insertion protein [Candidatus Entotheonellaceae bacterium PAL068K]
MRIAYFDCFAGISGDMTLGALVHAGVDIAVLREELAKLPVTGYRLEVSLVKRNGLQGTKVDVLVEESQPARKYTDIATMIADSALVLAVQERSLEIFHRLGEVEAHLHGVPLETVHFHEVGAIDSIVDVVGTVIGLHALEVTTVLASPVNVGSGSVHTAHGLLPVPAPATLELLRGCPSYASDIQLEMTTPTGAAILTTMASHFGTFPLMQVEQVGYGAGTKDPPGVPNLLRLIVGNATEFEPMAGHGASFHHRHGRHD